MTGRIIKILSNIYTVKLDNQVLECSLRGVFRKENKSPLVGDKVKVDLEKKQIYEIEKRKNELIRPAVSNVDQAFILISVLEPDFSSFLLDKFIAIITFNNIKPIICFTKLDLLKKEDKKEIKEYIKYYKKIGYEVVTNKQLFKIKRFLNNKITVFTGQTGVGKSTLLNKIKKDLNLKTAEISKALGRGKHTTRHVELFEVKKGLVSDTPGFSSLELIDMKKDDIRDSFIEFRPDDCEYKNCLHQNERKCAIKIKVKNKEILKSRYDNYIKMIEKSE